ncbi:MAG: glycosyltransferase [Verrucomicrobia bacterium]|nr:MAG: glycosyltransferase [Verrucomicrobiota bacterium]
MLTLPPPFQSPAPGERLRVLDLVQFQEPFSGGKRRYIEDKCRYFETVPEIEHRVIAPGDGHGEDRWGTSRLHTVAARGWGGGGGYRLPADRSAWQRLMRDFRPHVIEVGDPWLLSWGVRRLADELPARLVVYPQTDTPMAWGRALGTYLGPMLGAGWSRVLRAALTALYRRADTLVVANPMLGALWRAQGLRQVRCIPPGVDTGRFFPLGAEVVARTRAEWGLPAGARVLLHVGRLGAAKRTEWLAQVFATLRAQDPDLHLVFIGDGEGRGQAQEWAAEAGARVLWCPYLHSGPGLAEAYAAADVLLHAGLDNAFGLSVLEAQACGLPVVASRDGGLDSLVPMAAGLGHALVPASNLEAWASAIKHALAVGNDPRARTARHARVKAGFAWWRSCEALTQLYRDLAGLPPPGRVTGRVQPIGRWS